jgi:hypothetical protein
MKHKINLYIYVHFQEWDYYSGLSDEEKNDREWMIFKYNTFVWEQDTKNALKTVEQYRMGER